MGVRAIRMGCAQRHTPLHIEDIVNIRFGLFVFAVYHFSVAFVAFVSPSSVVFSDCE